MKPEIRSSVHGLTRRYDGAVDSIPFDFIFQEDNPVEPKCWFDGL